MLPAFAAGSDVEDGHAGPCRRARTRTMPLQIGHPMSRRARSGPGGTGLERHPAPRQAAHRAWSQRGATAPAVAGSAALPPARARWADSEVGGLETCHGTERRRPGPCTARDALRGPRRCPGPRQRTWPAPARPSRPQRPASDAATASLIGNKLRVASAHSRACRAKAHDRV
jgi:hypothetical protein